MKINNAKHYIPYSFEGMMANFGKNITRDEIRKNLEDSKYTLEHKFRDRNATQIDIKKECQN